VRLSQIVAPSFAQTTASMCISRIEVFGHDSKVFDVKYSVFATESVLVGCSWIIVSDEKGNQRKLAIPTHAPMCVRYDIFSAFTTERSIEESDQNMPYYRRPSVQISALMPQI
jgi:hypothetical protein